MNEPVQARCPKDGRVRPPSGKESMLGWSLSFLIIALLAGLLGFVSIAGTAAWIAKVLFVLFLLLFIVSLLFARTTRV
jgi:uncharacterized membrane protein YtjA (UPF0391 family)